MTNNLDILIYLLPFAFAVHNTEEVFSMEKWSKSIPDNIHKPVTTRQFAIAVIIFTILGFIIVFAKNGYASEKQFLSIVTGFAGMLFLNVFFPHLIATIFYKRYAPGVITGLVINLPISTIIIWTIYKTQKLSFGQIGFLVTVGGLIGIILAFLFLKIGDAIDKKLAIKSN